MAFEWDVREHGTLHAAFRGHLREITTARQVAEQGRLQAWLRSRDLGDRAEVDAAYQVELARIEGEHQGWLHAHGLRDVEVPAKRRLPPG